MKKQFALLAALALTCGAPAFSGSILGQTGFSAAAQTQKATGTVVDETGEPLPGVSIIVKGSQGGVASDIDGKFTLNAKPGDVLKFTYIGYNPVEVKFNGQPLNVTMKPDVETLDEIVVVGYGSQRREHLTGAVSSVDVAKNLQGRQIADVGRGLQGTTPGLNVVLPNGEIGSDPTIKIRGQVASLNGSANPLILLDNVEIPSIQLVNPDDIEQISVLKDAAAASIYGSKAAFGVILIKTKQGAKTDRVDISYSGNFAWQRISKNMEMGTIDASQYRVDALERSGSTYAGAFWYINAEALERQREWLANYDGKIGMNDPFTYGRDWYVDNNNRKIYIRPYDPYDYMIRDWAPSMTHNLSLNGKSGKTAFNIGLGYLDQNGLIKPSKHDDYRRYNASARINTEFNKWISVRGGLNYSLRNKRYAYATNSTTADPWLYLYRWDAYAPHGEDENGHLMQSPSTEMKLANTANREDAYLSVNAGFTINFTDNWHYKLDYTYASENQTINKPGTKFTYATTWYSPVERYDESGNRVYVNKAGQVVSSTDPDAMPAYDLNYYQYTADGANPDHIRRESTNAKRHTLNMTMDYNWDINADNNLTAMIGLNRTDWESKQHWSQITNLTDIVSPSFDKTNGTQTSSGNDYWDGQLGVFARLNYSLFDRYLLEANFRYDGSSKFPKNMKWRSFPSVSAGWRVDQEKFMQWAKPTLDSFKLRASWGRIGDQSVSSSLYIPTLSQSTLTWIDSAGNKFVGVGTPSAVDGSITWQDIETTNVGLDARLFGGLGIVFDWYQRDTKNMIVPAAGVPPTFGAAAPSGNYGNLRTRGWEIAIDYNHSFNKDLSINAVFTLSDARSTITNYSKSATSVDGWYDGKEYGEIWGYQVDRLYQKDDFLYNEDGSFQKVWVVKGKIVEEGTVGAKLMNKLADPNATYQDYFQPSDNLPFGPGDIKYVDRDGDGEFTIGDPNMIKLNGKKYRPGDPGYAEALANPEHEKVPTNSKDNPGDKTVIGNSTPRFEYGIRLGVNYRDFDFSIFGQGIGSRKIWGAGFLAIPGFNTGDGAIPQAIAGNYWREDRTDAFYPRAYNMGGSNSGGLFQQSDRYMLNMSYFRIKNITLGYTIPQRITRKAYIQKARFYIAAENFFTFDKLHGLPIDPEVVSGVSMWNSSNYNSGRTGVGTPAMKNINFGIQLNF
ncbi:MAG: TonB-dependent receptor [Bacteroides sp.]|nr:TonB-dependent receptor [Bacteroides sp.]MBD5380080.1 TonB-dependent receptor [Bacteroides sp.]